MLVARRLDRLEALSEEIYQTCGVRCRSVQQDLAQEDSADRLLDATQDIPVGILVNNAGVGYSGRFESLDPTRMRDMILVNSAAPVSLTRAFLPGMLQRGRGAILLVASISSFIPVPYDAVYGASKAFVLSFGEALWTELRDAPIDVISVCPYLTRTGFYEAEGMGSEAIGKAARRSDDPRAVARLALNGLGRRMTVAPWKTLLASWGVRLAPRWATALVMRRVMGDLHFDQVSSRR